MGLEAPLNSVSEPVGTLDVALSHAARLLEKDPRRAVEQADEILKAVPGIPTPASFSALPTAAAGIRNQPSRYSRLWRGTVALRTRTHRTRGCAGRGGSHAEAIATLRHALKLKPDSVDAWRLLADHLDANGDAPGRTGPARAT